MRRLLFAAVVGAITLAAAVPPPIAVYTRTKLCLLTCDFPIRITVQPDPANRRVCLRGDLNGFPNAYLACWNADGAKTTMRKMRLDEGTWTVYATVERNDGKTIRSMPLTLMVRGIHDLDDDPFETPTYDGP